MLLSSCNLVTALLKKMVLSHCMLLFKHLNVHVVTSFWCLLEMDYVTYNSITCFVWV